MYRLSLLLLLVLASLWGHASCPERATTPLAELRSGAVEEGERVVVDGVVTATFLADEQLGGFYLQQDGQPPSALFVYAPRMAEGELRPGSRVQLSGRFARFHGRPQLTRPRDLHDCGHVGLPSPQPLQLPKPKQKLEALAGVKVTLQQTLTVSGNYELARYGTLTLSAHGRLWRADEPRAANTRRIELDDGSYRANPRPIPYLNPEGTRRSGSTVEGLTGILEHAFDSWRIHPTRAPRFVEANPRPEPLPSPGDALRIATFNVENYFLTLGQRGAANRDELQRQRDKLRAAVRGLDADILALVEVENRPQALADLLRQLNAEWPEEQQYHILAHPHSGSDAIKVALLYRPARVKSLGAAADRDRVHNRAPLLGWFQPKAGGEPFGVVAVHFKAKVGCPRSGDIDRGEGCWNRLRTEQAEKLAAWIDEQRREEWAVMVAGDLNAYLDERPLQRFAQAGKRDLVALRQQPRQGYSYVFRAQAGRLDYLLASESLHGRVVDAGIWHINADEPPFLAYDGEAPGDGPWRSSDHDPVWVELH